MSKVTQLINDGDICGSRFTSVSSVEYEWETHLKIRLFQKFSEDAVHASMENKGMIPVIANHLYQLAVTFDGR